MTLAQQYHASLRTPSDISAQLPIIVQTCLDLNAQTVVELGTRGGVSTVGLLYAMEETDGHLWSVDIDPAPELTHDRWTFLHGSDLDPKIVARLPSDADVIFIDTSHLYEQTLAELNTYVWRVRSGGRILLHDTELRRPESAPAFPPYPVKRAVTEFCAAERLDYQLHPTWPGLGVINV